MTRLFIAEDPHTATRIANGLRALGVNIRLDSEVGAYIIEED